MDGHTKNSIYAAIILGVIRDLGIFPEYNFSTSGDKAKLGNIDFDHRPFCHHSQLGVHRWLRVLFDAQDLKLESRFEIGYDKLRNRAIHL